METQNEKTLTLIAWFQSGRFSAELFDAREETGAHYWEIQTRQRLGFGGGTIRETRKFAGVDSALEEYGALARNHHAGESV